MYVCLLSTLPGIGDADTLLYGCAGLLISIINNRASGWITRVYESENRSMLWNYKMLGRRICFAVFTGDKLASREGPGVGYIKVGIGETSYLNVEFGR